MHSEINGNNTIYLAWRQRGYRLIIIGRIIASDGTSYVSDANNFVS